MVLIISNILKISLCVNDYVNNYSGMSQVSMNIIC